MNEVTNSDELRELRTFILLEEIGELIRQGEAELRAYRDQEAARAFIDAAEAQQWIDEHEDEEYRYNHNHDSKGRFARSDTGLTGSGAGDRIHISGGVSGALDRYSKEAQKHADKYYEAVRHMKTDVSRIAQNTGFTNDEIKSVKNFVFIETHDLGGKTKERFYPSYEMAQSWQRLIEGKNIQPHDITLIKHELTELKLMKQGSSQSEAHRKAEKLYDYSGEVKNYYGKTDQHKAR